MVGEEGAIELGLFLGIRLVKNCHLTENKLAVKSIGDSYQYVYLIPVLLYFCGYRERKRERSERGGAREICV